MLFSTTGLRLRNGTLLPCGLGTSLWTTAPSAGTTSWTCASSARPTKPQPHLRSAPLHGECATTHSTSTASPGKNSFELKLTIKLVVSNILTTSLGYKGYCKLFFHRICGFKNNRISKTLSLGEKSLSLAENP